jgi:D-sedoheptulose 7-phosphate isomerase
MAPLAADVDAMVGAVADAVSAGRTLFTCGNGGSSADALHLAEEFVGRYRSNRRPLPAVCLNADVTALTCIANDFGYEAIFARQLAALGRPGDVLVVFSTSGNSPNILRAIETAREREMLVVGLLGKDGGAARELTHHAIIVPSANTARIQEAHGLLLHAICEEVEQRTMTR